MKIRRLFIGSVLFVACSGSADNVATASSNPAESLAAVDPVTSEFTPSSLPFVETTSAPPASTPEETLEETSEITLPDGPVCDWLYAASFGDEFGGASIEGLIVEWWGDDWVDTRTGECRDDSLIIFSEQYDQTQPPEEEVLGSFRVSNGVLTLDLDGQAEPASQIRIWDEITVTDPPNDPLLASAHAFGLEVMTANLAGDGSVLIDSLLNPFYSLEDGPLQLVTPEFDEPFRNNPQIIAEHFEDYTIRDYLTSYDPTIVDLDLAVGVENAAELRALYPDAEIVYFDGSRDRDNVRSTMSQSNWYLNLVLVSSDAGVTWQIASI